MLWIDVKYVSLLSSRFQKFKKVGDNTFNLRCPLCGDSKKNRNKARGYFFPVKNDALRYRCHNCGASLSLDEFLKQTDSTLHTEYIKELLLEKYTNKSRSATPVGVNSVKKDITKINRPKMMFDSPMTQIKKVSALAHDHPVLRYVKSRKIPPNQHYRLFYAPKFKTWINTFIPDKFEDVDKDEPRLVLPFLDTDGSFIGVSARSFGKTEPRYYTIYFDRTRPRVFGLDVCNLKNKVYITEGPIDSLFVPNSIAMMGLDINFVKELGINKDNLVFVLDNQPRNPEMCKVLETLIDSGYNVFLWPTSVESKDINDLVLSGFKQEDIKTFIDTNVFRGLQAKLKFTAWKNC